MEPHIVSQKNVVLAAIAAVLVLAGAGAAWFFLRPGAERGNAVTSAGAPAATVALPPAGPVGKLPDPVIAVLDRTAILQYSKVGQDIMRQMQAFTNQARQRITSQRTAIERDA